MGLLKVCSPPSEVKLHVSKKWIIQPQGYMMSCFDPMTISAICLPNDYQLEISTYNSVFVIRIVTKKGKVASIGRLILVDELGVYDRILTDENYRRKGLARFLMKQFEKIALSKGITKNFLVATEEGKPLYESLGWNLYSLYTAIVIPL